MPRRRMRMRRRSKSLGSNKFVRFGGAMAAGAGIAFAVNSVQTTFNLPLPAPTAALAGVATAFIASKGLPLPLRAVTLLPALGVLGINVGSLIPGLGGNGLVVSGAGGVGVLT